VASFSVATDKRRKKDNNQGPTADFHDCIAWEKLAETIGNNFVKGKEILIRGRLETRNYEAQDGTRRYRTEVIVENMEFCGSKTTQAGAVPPAGGGFAGNSFGGDISDEEIPF
jgi:single-strand DNA-binding protein